MIAKAAVVVEGEVAQVAPVAAVGQAVAAVETTSVAEAGAPFASSPS